MPWYASKSGGNVSSRGGAPVDGPGGVPGGPEDDGPADADADLEGHVSGSTCEK